MRRFASIVLSAGLVGGLLGIPAAQAEPAAHPMAQPAAVATIAGTPTELLASLPVTEPLTVGYTGGLFNSPADLKKKDKRGCTYRNQVLLKLATKKPRIGKNCSLSGGEWRADFGRTVIKKASQVKLGKLLPDKFVYAQGAYGWTPEQRKAYANSTTTVAKSTRMSIRGLIDENNVQLFSSSGLRVASKINVTLSDSKDPNQLEAELANLKIQSPEFFESWTVASLLNAKSWGLSFSLGVYASTSKTLRDCTKDPDRLDSIIERSLKSADPCNNIYSIINQAIVFKIAPIPIGSSQTPPVSSAVLSGYGTPQGAPIDRHLFGIHAPADWVSDLASGFDGPIKEATIPSVPVGYLRLWDTETTWRDIEPTNGEYVWRKLNKQIEMAQILDARVMLVLGSTPAWAGDGSVQSNPRNIADWRDYVGTVACRYGASISAYEVWNEANLQTFWKGTPAEMAELTKVAFEEIRRCNPNALVVAANTTSRATGSFGTFFPEYLEEMKKRGWPADAYSVHSYPSASGGADDRIKGISQFRSMLALAGAPFTTTFDSEINYGLAGLGEGKVDLTGETAMALLARTYIDSARYGFGSTFWFVWTANPDSKFGIQFTQASQNERVAWRSTYDWLVGAQYQRCFETPEKVVVCQFNKGADNFSLVWRGDVGSPRSSTDKGYFSGLGSQVCDLYGNCDFLTTGSTINVGPMPIRINGAPLSSGPSPTPTDSGTPATDTEARIPLAPMILDVDLTYGPSNKADATATWLPPANAEQAGIISYNYSWHFGRGAKYQLLSRGSTKPQKLSVTTDLSEGPGTYEFRVTAVGKGGVGITATQRVELLNSRAAPPSNVIIGAIGTKGEVAWTSPNMRSSLIKGYEVQIQESISGTWKTLDEAASGRSLKFTDESLRTGQVITARVRTVLKSGAKSIFVASSPLTVDEQLPTPQDPIAINLAFNSTDTPVIVVSARPNSNLKDPTFPGSAYQVRYSNDDGLTWDFLRFGSDVGGTVPRVTASENTTLIPYDRPMYIEPEEGAAKPTLTTRYEMRAVDSSGRPPSDWIGFTPSNYFSLFGK
jgi:cytochrome c2